MKTIEKKIPELRFPEFEGQWGATRLGKLGELLGGLTYSPSNINADGLLVLRSSNIKHNTIVLDDTVYVDVAVDEKSISKAGDILICVRNGSTKLIGKNALIPASIPKATHGAFMTVLRSDESKFVLQLLKTEAYYRQVYADLGARINSINSNQLRKYVFYVPVEKNEQKKIANFLNEVDDKIQQLTKKKNLLEQYKKGIMEKIFSQQIRFKDGNGKNYPKWEEKQLGRVVEPQIREITKPKNAYLAIGIRSHCKGTFQKPNFNPNKIMMDKLYVVKENDLIVNITFAWEGAIALVKKEDEGGLVSHRFPTYVFNRQEATHEFFQYSFIQKKFRFLLDLISPGGAGRNRVLSKKDFLKLKWWFPCVAEQNKIANFLQDIDKKIDHTTKQMEKTQAFKKGLLQQMFV